MIFATYSSPVGYIHIEHKENRLTRLQILQSEPIDFGVADAFTDEVFSQLMAYFRGELWEFDLDLDLGGCTPFQRDVYRALCKIPYGRTCSYKDIAMAIGKVSASRAVGMANHRNPIHIIIPCHRVVGSKGSLTGYASGIEAKAFLLDMERLFAQHDQ